MKKEEQEKVKWMTKKLAVVLTMVMLLLASGCGSNDEAMMDMATSSKSAKEETRTESKMDDSVEEVAMERTESGSGGSYSSGMNSAATQALQNRMIIKTAGIYMETLDFDQTTNDIKVLMNKYSGYTSHSQVEGGTRNKEYNSRFATYTIKVPAENFEMLFEDVKEVGHVLNATDNIEDVTSTVFDIEARLVTLRVQEERMLEILAKLENLEDIVELEYALQDVRYEIESYSSNLRNIEDRVRYSTITLRVQEVYEETVIVEPPLTLGDRISQGLDETFGEIKEGSENFLVFIITQFPYLLILALIVVVLVVLIKKGNKKNIASINDAIKKPSDLTNQSQATGSQPQEANVTKKE